MNSKFLSMLLLLMLGAFFVTPSSGSAQALVAFPEADAVWTVTFKPVGNAPGKQRVKIDVVRQGPARRDTTTWSDGSSSLLWWAADGSVALMENGPPGHVSSMRGGRVAGQRYDASAFAWVDKPSFVKELSYNGKTCNYYEKEIVEDDGGGPKKLTLRAWIDKETGRPVGLDNGHASVIFTFPEGDVPALTMPANLLEKLTRVRELNAPARRNRS